ncbi:zf-HC2 domain-containing protein [Haloactinopolyspora sp.]|uniref:anti-sigma factor family protein n=1 Tax=Haloactinopolyspora sp. TaxID=1966353 RepID=UPI00262E95A2|nr:zf-HC2 domain-containing protein [Haloactinopolyspora sp.]
MKHLDERVSDLVDDRLDHDERDRALVHLTECAQCRNAVEDERHAKNALRSLPDVAPSATLVQNLLALAEPGDPLPPEAPGSAPAPVADWRTRESHPPSRPGGRRLPRRVRTMRVAAVGMCTSGAMLILLAALGSPSTTSDPSPTPAGIVPPVEEFTLEHARSTGALPFVEPASLLVRQAGSLGGGW